MNAKLNQEIYNTWKTLNLRDDGMGCEFVEEIPIEAFYDICKHFYNFALNDVQIELENIDDKYRTIRADRDTPIQRAKEADLVIHVLHQFNNFIERLMK